jgi:hypothetical protein
MTTGYIAPAGDLDLLFKARTSTAIANTGFLSNGGVDLAQRFEPRGSVPPIANTGFRNSAGTDLALLFRNIAGATSTGNLSTAFNSGRTGYSDGNVESGIVIGSWTGTMPPSCTASNLLAFGSSNNTMALKNTFAQSWCANVDSVWASLEITGIFSDSGGVSVTRSVLRSACTYTVPTPAAGFFFGKWSWSTPIMPFLSGTTYTTRLSWA